MRQEHLIDQHKTKAELITELAELRQEVSRLRAMTEDASTVTGGRILTEQALRKSEAINRALFDAMPDLVIRLHRNGDYLDFQVPKGFKAINPADETIGKNIYELLPAEIAQQRIQQVEKTLQTGEIQVAEYQLNLAHGIQYEEARIVPAGDDEVLAIIRDITERKQAEQVILGQQELLGKIIDGLPVGVIVKDVQNDYCFTIWNNKMEEMFGIKREELLGKTDYDHFPQEQADFYRQTDIAVVTGSQMIDVPVEEITTVQGPRLAHTVKFPIFDNQGIPQFLLAVLEDITERKQAEQTIVQQREMLDKIINNLPVGVFAKDVRNDYRFTIWNTKMEEMFGTPRQDILGKNDYDLFVDNEEVDYYRQTDVAVIDGGQVVDIPVEEVTTSRGMMLSHTIKLPIYDEQGYPQLLVGVLDDITDRKQAETELKEAQERAQAILESVMVPLLISRVADGVILYANTPLARLILLPREELVGQQTPNFYNDPAERATVIGLIQSQGYINDYELHLRRSNGEVFWALLSVRIFNFQGETALITTLIDITERKQAETERARLLAEVEATYRQYVQREWAQFLQERPEMQQVVHQSPNLPAPLALDNLARLEAEVLREGKTKTLAPVKDNGHVETAAIVTPLSLRGQVIGALSLQDIDPDRQWTAEDIALVETVSEQLALTLENLRLFEDTQRSAWRDQVVSETTAKVWSASQMEEVLKAAVAQLGDKLQASEVVIRLGTEAELAQE